MDLWSDIYQKHLRRPLQMPNRYSGASNRLLLNRGEISITRGQPKAWQLSSQAALLITKTTGAQLFQNEGKNENHEADSYG
jgi:hypothetical protein